MHSACCDIRHLIEGHCPEPQLELKWFQSQLNWFQNLAQLHPLFFAVSPHQFVKSEMWERCNVQCNFYKHSKFGETKGVFTDAFDEPSDFPSDLDAPLDETPCSAVVVLSFEHNDKNFACYFLQKNCEHNIKQHS